MRSLTPRLLREHVPVVRAPATSRVRGLPIKRLPGVPSGPGVLQKCDKLKIPDSPRIENLRKKSEYSSKDQINDFIQSQVRKAEEDIAASVIQQHWRETMERRKNRVIKEPVKMKPLSIKYNFVHPIMMKWHELAEDFHVMKRIPSAYSSYLMRKQFGPLFWAFQILKRINIMKNHNKFYKYECYKYFLIEWNIYHANIRRQEKLDKNSIKFRRHHLIIRSFAALNNYMVEQKNKNIAISPYKLNKLLLTKCLKILQYNGKLQHFIKQKKHKIISNWYLLIDRKILNRNALNLLQIRTNLQLFKKYFTIWQKNSSDYLISDSLITYSIRKHRNELTPFFYLMQGDFIHYTFIKAFVLWKNRIAKSHTSHSFAAFAINDSRQITVKRYLFECFKFNAGMKCQKIFSPFKTHQQVQQSHRKRRSVFMFTEVTDLDLQYTLKAPTSNLIDALQNQFTQEDPCGSLETLNRFQLRTVLYHLILIYGWRDMRQDLIKTHKSFKITPEIFFEKKFKRNMKKLRKYKLQLENVIKKESFALRRRTQRDLTIISAHDAHEAAKEWSDLDPRFKVVSETKPISSVTILTEEVMNNNASSSPANTPETHPLLRKLSEVRDDFMKFQRSLRRAPKEIFPEFRAGFHIAFHNNSPATEDPQAIQALSMIESPSQAFKIPQSKNNRKFALQELQDLIGPN